MPKKPTESMMPPAVEADVNAGVLKADPTVLGVTMPLNMTLAAVEQVSKAWRECALALFGALKAKVAKPLAPKDEATPSTTTDSSVATA